MKQADINLYQGADFNLLLTIVDSMGNGINLTGYAFLSQLRATTDPTVTSPIANFSFTQLDQSSFPGQVQWTMPLATIATIPTSISTVRGWSPTPYIYDVKMKDATGNVVRLVQGTANVFGQVTQVPFT
jgi:hypothetical protein